jgi:hypothetical protein
MPPFLLPIVAEQRGKFGDVCEPPAIEFLYDSVLPFNRLPVVAKSVSRLTGQAR